MDEPESGGGGGSFGKYDVFEERVRDTSLMESEGNVGLESIYHHVIC